MEFDFSTYWSNIVGWLSTSGIKIVAIIIISWIGLRILHAIIHRGIKKAVEHTYHIRGEDAIDKRVNTIHKVMYSLLHVVVWLVVALIILSEFNINIGPFLAAAGVAGLAIGFGAQYLIRDLIAGIFIIMEDQYRQGDVVKVAGVSGLVEQITLRTTTLRDLDGIEHHVPNGEITTTSNFTKLYSRAHLNIGIAYDSDLEKAMEVLNRIGKELAEDKDWRDQFIHPISVKGVDDFADSAIIIKVLGDTKPLKQWDIMREYRKRVKLTFDKEGIEIPYPHRTIVQKK
jgi:small conductance mechanosensitive channel